MADATGSHGTVARPGVSPYWLLAAVAAGVFFAADDQTSVVTILPPIISDLDLSVAHFERIAWIVNGYLLGYTVAMPLMGRVADVYGHARIFTLALVIFMVGSALVAVSPNLPWLVAARSFQAIGGGAVVPVAMAIVAGTLPPGRRAMGIGVMAAASEFGALIGPLWGSGVNELLGWRGLFWINLPMVAPVAVAVVYLARDVRTERRRVDYAGGALLGLALTALTIALTNASDAAGDHSLALPFAVSALAFGVWFVRHERRAADPMIDLRLFRSAAFSGGNLTNLLVGGGLIVALVNVPLMTNVLFGDTPLEGGLNLTRFTVAVPIGAVAGGWLAGWLGFSRTTVVGLALAATGFFLMAAWGEAPAELLLSGSLIVAGLGFGLVIAPVGTAVINAAPDHQHALASSLVTVLRTIGMTVGLALLASQGLARFTERAAVIPLEAGGDYTQRLDAVMSDTFAETFVVAGIAMVLAIIPALFLGREPKEEIAPEDRMRSRFWLGS